MASFRKIGRNWFYRYVDGDGKQRERKGCPDRRETERIATASEAEAARVRAGLSDTKSERLATAERKPIGSHLDDFISALTAKGATPSTSGRRCATRPEFSTWRGSARSPAWSHPP
jgi:hypothetical protein